MKPSCWRLVASFFLFFLVMDEEGYNDVKLMLVFVVEHAL